MSTIVNAGRKIVWPPWATAALMGGDVVLFLVFTVLGRREHHLAITWVGTLETAVPLTAAWLVVGLLAGVFRPEMHQHRPRFIVRLTIAWLIACVLGIVTRARYLNMPIAWNFALVTFGLMLVLLAGWHMLFHGLLQRRSNASS